MAYKIDSTDRKILKYLMRDARTKVVEIASYIGVTSAAIHQRINKIKAAGLIKEFTLRLNEKAVGYTTCAFVGIFIDKNSHYNEIIERVKMVPEIVEAHYTTGQYGLFVKIYARDNDHLMEVLSGRVQKIKGVTRTETFISLEESINRNVPV